MAEKFKLVILFDAKNNTYMVADHNLKPEEAEEVVRDLRINFLPALTVNQQVRHNRECAEACRSCRHEVVRASGLTPRPRFQRRNQQ
jgi:hypothetical protein